MLTRVEKRFGTKILPDGQINFNLWAPDADKIDLCIKQADGSFLEFPMDTEKDGWFSINTGKAKIGSEYMFKIDGGLMVPDPASRAQTEDVHDPSVVIDPNSFDWSSDLNWKGRSWCETVLYELHTGSFTEKGTFAAIKEKLDYLVSLGITAIELMPVADFPGKRNWGYDGVLQFAPDNSYGTPDELKDLIKTAHEKGLMVFLDVVYNHFGPDGNYLYVYAKSQFFEHKHTTPWGDAINFENRNVRDFYIQNVLYWLQEYRFDGLRFDAVHAIKDDSPMHILDEIAQITREEIKDRNVHLVLENDDNIAKFLKQEDNNRYYEAQWNDDFHHGVHIHLTGEKTGYYEDYIEETTSKSTSYYLARCLAEGFAYQGERSAYRDGELRGENSKNLNVTSFVNFIQNHDQIGNRALGDRLGSLASSEALKAAACLYLVAPSVPLMFMGEEWGSEQPFLFFCDFGEDLSNAVREGRKKEFAKFPEFSDPKNQEKIPDPTSETTFKKSFVDWDSLNIEKHKDMFEFYQKMLNIRHKQIIPLIPEIEHSKSCFEIMQEGVFRVKWMTKTGKMLEVVANLTEKNVDCDYDFNQNHIAKTHSTPERPGELSAWSVYWSLR